MFPKVRDRAIASREWTEKEEDLSTLDGRSHIWRKKERLPMFEMEVTVEKKNERDEKIVLARICMKARKLPLML